MELLEETHGVVNHVRLLCELILGCLDLLDGEEIALGKMCKEGKDEVTVAVGDDRFCEVVVGHDGQTEEIGGAWGRTEASSSCGGACSMLPTGQKMTCYIGMGARGRRLALDALDTSALGPHVACPLPLACPVLLGQSLSPLGLLSGLLRHDRNHSKPALVRQGPRGFYRWRGTPHLLCLKCSH